MDDRPDKNSPPRQLSPVKFPVRGPDGRTLGAILFLDGELYLERVRALQVIDGELARIALLH